MVTSNKQDTICAMATPSGMGAIAVIRLSGQEAISICDSVFQSHNKSKKLANQQTHTLHLGFIKDGEHIVDEVLVSLFHGPNSYTGENVVEISCHGSVFIQQQLIQLFIRSGARMAKPGEYTLRAFVNGKMDLSQAEAVADLINSENEASHKVALQQMRGGFSNQIKDLRQQLINFASLIELELDFSEEDVEFADRTELNNLLQKITTVLKKLVDSFAVGNVIKNGIPVAIVGEPNAGKSTLLNALLNEERAIVSEIAGTTRDSIEDELIIDGISFRFIDTAGIRETTDTVESIGIKRTYEKISQADVVLYLFDATDDVNRQKAEIEKLKEKTADKKLIIIANKIDLADEKAINKAFSEQEDFYTISAKQQTNIPELTTALTSLVNTGALNNNETIVTNSRHYEALTKALEAITNVQQGMESSISGDLLAIDIRQSLYHLGEITGEVTPDDLLGNIFANFCIGK